MGKNQFPSIKFIEDRNQFLVDSCKDKNVLHLGCADAIHYKDNEIIGRYLHLRLMEQSNLLYGVDLSQEVLDYLKEKYNVANLYVDNVENLTFDSNKVNFDVIIAGELIEHLYNPGLFLQSVKKYMNKNTKLIITTPNLLSLKLFLHNLKSNQRIHPDHTLGFTFSLIKTLFNRFDLTVSNWYTSNEIFETNSNKIANSALKWFFRTMPRFGDTMICVAKLKSD